jgi:hypothetical protein
MSVNNSLVCAGLESTVTKSRKWSI